MYKIWKVGVGEEKCPYRLMYLNAMGPQLVMLLGGSYEIFRTRSLAEGVHHLKVCSLNPLSVFSFHSCV